MQRPYATRGSFAARRGDYSSVVDEAAISKSQYLKTITITSKTKPKPGPLHRQNHQLQGARLGCSGDGGCRDLMLRGARLRRGGEIILLWLNRNNTRDNRHRHRDQHRVPGQPALRAPAIAQSDLYLLRVWRGARLGCSGDGGCRDLMLRGARLRRGGEISQYLKTITITSKTKPKPGPLHRQNHQLQATHPHWFLSIGILI
jgi:hypothetical protein